MNPINQFLMIVSMPFLISLAYIIPIAGAILCVRLRKRSST